jgi:hypothetical protein
MLDFNIVVYATPYRPKLLLTLNRLPTHLDAIPGRKRRRQDTRQLSAAGAHTTSKEDEKEKEKKKKEAALPPPFRHARRGSIFGVDSFHLFGVVHI